MSSPDARDPQSTPDPAKDNTSLPPSEIKETLNGLYGELLSGNLSALGDLFSEDVVLEDPASTPWGGKWSGKDRVLEALPSVSEKMGLAGAEVHDILTGNNQGVAVITLKHKNKAGEVNEMSVLEYFRFDNSGKITAIKPHFYDVNQMMDFLGT
jgi:ketosteroid isomerase-like protein